MNGSGGLDENPTPPGLSAVSPLNYSAASQFSMFVPLANSFVIGGSVTGSKIGSGVQGAPSDLGLSSILGQTVPEGSLQTSASSTGEFFSGSVLAARRFGANTSVGIEIESLQGTGSLAAQILSTGQPSGSIERIDSGSTISQRRITAGVERDLPHGQTLGFFYRYGLIEAADNDTSHTLNNRSRAPRFHSFFRPFVRIWSSSSRPVGPEAFLWSGGVLARAGAQRRPDAIDRGRFASAGPRAAKLRGVGLWLFSQPADGVERRLRRWCVAGEHGPHPDW